jgi:leucine dehydrogenase
VFAQTPEAGGAGSSGPYTTLGVFTAIQTACEHVFGIASLEERTVLVQGTGSVGGTLIDHLLDAGAEVLFSEVSADLIQQFRDDRGLHFVTADEVSSTECDVLSPCALGGVINPDSIPKLKCRIIAGGANNQLSQPGDAEKLHARGILYAPDYVVSIGGAMAITGMEAMGWSSDKASQTVIRSVRGALERIFHLSTEYGITTEEAARRIALENLAK